MTEQGPLPEFRDHCALAGWKPAVALQEDNASRAACILPQSARELGPARTQSRSQRWSALAGLLLAVCSAVPGLCAQAPRALTESETATTPRVTPSPDAQVAAQISDADSALNDGNVSLALIQLRNAVRLSPRNGEVRAHLGRLLIRAGDVVAAERELRQARRDNAPDDLVVPNILRAMLQRNALKELLMEFPEPPLDTRDGIAADVSRARAIAFQMLGQIPEAIEASDRALQLRRDANALITRAKLARLQNDIDLAHRLTAEAIKLAPGDDESLILNISLLRQLREPEQALALLDEFEKTAPESTLPKVLRVETLLQLGRDDRAQAEIDAILKLNPNSTLAVYYRATSRLLANDFTGAWRLAQNLPTAFVQSQPVTAISVARMAASSGNVETASAILSTLLATRPDATEARLQLAAIRLGQNAPDLALATLAPIVNRDTPLVNVLFAQAFLQLRRFNDAIPYLENALSAAGDDELLQRQLVISQLQVGDTDEGIKGLRILQALDPTNTATGSLLIGALLRSGEVEEALVLADQLVKEGAGGALPSFLRGQALIAQGRLADASAAFGQALDSDATFYPALYYGAKVSYARGDYENAVRVLNKILSGDPRNVPAYVQLSQMALNNGRHTSAVAVLNRGIQILPDDLALKLALANCQAFLGRFQEARSTLNGYLAINPNEPEVLALLGQIQIVLGAQRDGIDTLRKLVTVIPQSPAGYILLAKALSTRDPLAAEDAARSALKLASNSPAVWSLLVDLQIAHNKPDDGLRTARTYIDEHPGTAADLLLSNTLIRLNRATDAAEVLRKSLGTRPDQQVAIQLGRLELDRGDNRHAAETLRDWLRRHPDDFDVRLEYAVLLMKSGNSVDARMEFETLLKRRPDDPVVLNNLGWLIREDEPDRAFAYLSLASRIEPQSAEIADSLGWTMFERRDLLGARMLLRRAYAQDPDSAWTSYHLAIVLDASGQRGEAKTLLESLVSRNAAFAESENARNLLARW